MILCCIQFALALNVTLIVSLTVSCALALLLTPTLATAPLESFKISKFQNFVSSVSDFQKFKISKFSKLC